MGIADADGHQQDIDLDINRLIMVATTYRPWPPGESSCTKHRKLLTTLLAASVDQRPCFARIVRVDASASGTGAETGRAPERLEWLPEHDERLDELVEELRRFSIHEIAPPDGYDPHQRNRVLNSLTHRVFLDHRALDGLIGTRPYGRAVACLDFRFADVFQAPMCVVSLSVWTALPYSEQHHPQYPPGHDNGADHDGGPTPGEVTRADVEYLTQIRKHIHDLLDHYFPAPTRRIANKPYLAPLFWIAAPTAQNKDIALPDPSLPHRWEEDGKKITNRLSVRLLGAGDVRDSLMSWGVLCGQFLTLRRVMSNPTDNSSQPSYLILPAPPRIPDDSQAVESGPGLAEALRRQEETAADLIIELTRLELYGTEKLFDIAAELDIWHNHLRAYDRAVDEADSLWDRLATHLLLHRSNTPALDQAHRAIQLMHQTLLQAVADVNLIARIVDDCVGRIDAVRDDLVDKFNAKITAMHPADDESLHDALTSSGNFRYVRERGDQVAKTAARVRGHYSDVMTAITQAFDERRVREGDRIQKAGATLSAALSGIALVTVLDVIANWKFDLTGNQSGATSIGRILLTAFSVLLGLIVIYFIFDFRVRTRGIPLAKREYADNYYPLVWNYLRRSSTERLNRHGKRVKQAEQEIAFGYPGGGSADSKANLEAAEAIEAQRKKRRAELWNALDRDLSRELSSVWDAVYKYQYHDEVVEPRGDSSGSWRDLPAFTAGKHEPALRTWDRLWNRSVHAENRKEFRDDLTRLQRQVENWSLQALVLTERPRELWRYELPLLTCLYRALDVPAWAVKPHHQGGTFRAVADVDFMFAFDGGDFSAAEIVALRQWLDNTLDRQGEQPGGRGEITDLVSLRELLEKTGVQVGMEAEVLGRLGLNGATRVP